MLFAENGAIAALTLRDGLSETHLGLGQGQDAALEDFAVKATDDVLVRLVLVFSCYFNCHIGYIIPQHLLSFKYFMV